MTSNITDITQMTDDQKRALLQKMVKEKSRQPTAFPLSFSQQQLWFLDQMAGHETTYNVPSYLRLQGDLDVPALFETMQVIVDRHESLRTSFGLKGEQPVQLVYPHMTLRVPMIDLQGLPPRIAHSVLKSLYEAEKSHRFDLGGNKLLRVHLLRMNYREHVLMLNIHHILTDGWSTMVMVGDLSKIYRARVKDQPDPLPPVALQYADFAKWQREKLAGESLERELAYFKETLKDVPPLLALPTDFPRPAIQSFEQKACYLTLGERFLDGLLQCFRQGGGTLFMGLLSAFQILLSRYSGQADIAVSSPIANRHRKELEQIVGFFVNSIVLYNRIEERDSFFDLLKRVKKSTIEAYRHQHVPFDRVIDALRPERGLSHTPLTQARFSLKNIPAQNLALPGLSIDVNMPDLEMGQVDLMMAITQNPKDLEVRLQYNAKLFKEATVQRMLAHFKTLLAGIIDKPEEPLTNISHLDIEERRQHLLGWRGKSPRIEQPYCFKLVEKWACDTPEAVAVAAPDGEMTYAALDENANRLADYLISQGIVVGNGVALYLDQSRELVLSMMAVMKTGAYYVPLDTQAPINRVEETLARALPSLVLSTTTVFSASEMGGVPVRHLDRLANDLAGRPDTPPCALADDGLLAYCVYTSGSTGVQKGVGISHRALANYIAGVTATLGFARGETHSSPSTAAADLWTTALYGALGNGGTLLVIPHGLRLDPARLADLFDTYSLDYLKVVPVHLTSLLSGKNPRLLPRRALLCGGEKLPARLVGQIRAIKSDCRIFNHYGPAETTIGATIWEVPMGEPTRDVPIGLPLGNAQALVLDTSMNLTSVGVTGELHIGGPSLARGYLGMPGLTAERFLPHPYETAPGARLYKTGDLVRRREDGALIFLGRRDHQVKIRGFRVELSEIEKAIAGHEHVAAALATTRADEHGNQRLVAFVVLTAGRTLSEEALRAFIKPGLPDYMLPAHVAFIEALPVTANGKIDTDRLPEVNFKAIRQVYVPPSSETERQLAEIWQDVLGRDKVGIHDNFFAIGGDSILSILVVTRARSLGMDLTPQTLFESPTIADLAREAGSGVTATREQGPITGIVPLSPIQTQFFDRLAHHAHHWNQAVLLESLGIVDLDLLKQAFNLLANHHDMLRARYVRKDEGWQQVLGPVDTAPLEIEICDMRGKTASDPEFAAKALAIQAGLDLTSGPLWRAAWFDFGPDAPAFFLVVIHHLVIDGVSWRILLTDLHQVYARLQKGETPALPPKTTSFKQWSEKVHSHAQSEAVIEDLAWWRDLEGLNVALVIVDPGAANKVGATDTLVTSLSAEDTQKLLFQVHGAYQTQINDILLAALVRAYSDWADSGRLLVAVEGHGREDQLLAEDLSRTLGWFTTIFPVLLDLGDQPSIEKTLKNTKERLRGMPQRGFPFSLAPLRTVDDRAEWAAGLPSPPLRFNYLGRFDQNLPQAALFRLSQLPSGPVRHAEQDRHYELEIDCWVAENRLSIHMHYVPERLAPESLARFGERYLKHLREIIEHCASGEGEGYTPSDFADVALEQEDLDSLLDEIAAADLE